HAGCDHPEDVLRVSHLVTVLDAPPRGLFPDCLVRHLVQVTTLSTARPDLVQGPKTLVVDVAHWSLLLLLRSIHLTTRSVRSSLDTAQATTAMATFTAIDRIEHTVLAVTWITTSGPRRYAPGPAPDRLRRLADRLRRLADRLRRLADRLRPFADLSSDLDPSCWGDRGNLQSPRPVTGYLTGIPSRCQTGGQVKHQWASLHN